MDRIPPKNQDRRSHAHGLRRRTLLVVATTFGLFTTPSAAAGSPLSASYMTPLAKPALCAGVGPSAISRVVGYRVPAPTVSTDSSTFDQQHNVSTFQTICSYGTFPAPTSVLIAYQTLSKSLPPSTIEQDIKASAISSKPSGATYLIMSYRGLSVPGLYEQETGSVTLEAILGIKGSKIVGAAVGKMLSKSKIAALTKLGMENYF
jgi:hypothetical protein